MISLFSFLNRLLPFATPGTPIVQDLAHLGAVCALLYFAPQIQQWWQLRQDVVHVDDVPSPTPSATALDPPRDRVVEAEPDEAADIPAPNGTADGPMDQADPNVNDPGAAPAEVEPAQGPAYVPQATNQRAVGAKKAKALAKRDQRRAHFEFLREEGERKRAEDAEGATEREALLTAERERRRVVEAAIEAKRTKEREAKREAEKREREEEIRRRDLTVLLVKESLDEVGRCDLWRVARAVGGDVDDEWVERMLRATGLLGLKNGVVTMVTSVGWAVRVSEEDVARMYHQAIQSDLTDEQGAVSFEQLGGVLDGVLQRPAALRETFATRGTLRQNRLPSLQNTSNPPCAHTSNTRAKVRPAYTISAVLMAMSIPDTHTRKRQFQPSISSYFSRASSDGSPIQTVSPLSPPLPVETQASLLSVGMRVRKSIPEGYKTHKTIGAMSFPFPSSAPPMAPPPIRPMFYTEHSRELAPFCGIHKVGGYALQPSSYIIPPSSAPSRLAYAAQLDDFRTTAPALSMSQSTISSTQSSMASSGCMEQTISKKRTYEEEIEDDMDDIFDELDAEEERAPAPVRPMAKVRGTPRKAMATERVAVVDDDFEEAPFLVPMDVGM
ncbi:hypothetical protein LTR95_009891 [Oleoguttula sp. CCFEE 5521]